MPVAPASVPLPPVVGKAGTSKRQIDCPDLCRSGRHAAAPGVTPTHNLFLRADHAGDDIDGGDRCFCIVAV
jgi:hypothetical protein